MRAPLTPSAAWQGRLAAVRAEAVDSSLALLAALSLPAVALVVLRATVVGWRPGMAAALGLTGVLGCTYLARGRLPAAPKAAVALGALLAAGLDGLLSFGLASYGGLYLLAFALLATLLLGPRWGLRALGGAVAMACALSLAVAARRLTFPLDLNAYNAAPVAWLGLPVTLAFLAGALLAVGGRLYAALVEGLRASAERAEALRESEARQAAILQAIPDLIFRISRAGEYLDVRVSQERLLYAPREGIVGRTVGELMPPEVAGAGLAAIARALETGTPQVVEYELPLPEGRRQFEARLVVSGPDEVVSMVRDITERKRAEEAMGRLVALVDNSSDAIIGLGLDRTITSWNPGAERLYGYTAAEAVGRPIGMLAVPGGPNEAALIGATLRRGESVVDLDTVRRGKDGSVVPVSMSVSHVRDGNGAITGAVETHRDISGRKAAEAALARANAELETLIRVLPVGVGIADDPAVGRVRMNPADARMLGLPVEANASLGAPEGERPATYRIFQRGRELAAAELPLQVAAATGREVRDMEYEVVRADGVRLTQLVNAAPLFDERGRVRGAVAAGLDISARVLAERQRDVLVAGLAHDLKNPVSALIWLAEALQRRATDPEEARLLERFVGGARQVLAQINELVDTTRGQLGRPLELDLRRGDLAELVAHVAAEQADLSGDRRIVVEGAHAPLPGVYDEARLGRALANVLGNALKYSAPGGEVVVSLARAEGAAGSWATIRVADRGIGIPAAEVGRVFEPFFRASNAQPGQQGSGLGLAGVRQVAEAHGGSVELASEEGAGTTATIRLPLRPPGLPGAADEEQ